MNNLVEQAEQWYSSASARWAGAFSTKLSLEAEPDRRAVTFHVDTRLLSGTITLWNKGEVETVALHRLLNQHLLLDVRSLNASDDIESLLDGYVQQIVNDGTLPGKARGIEIKVFGTTADDWRLLVQLLHSRYKVSFTKNGIAVKWPGHDAVAVTQTGIRLSLDLAGLEAYSRFADDTEIDLEIEPEEVKTAIQAQMIGELMIDTARLLNKEVLLTPARAGATIEWLRDNSLCLADPRTGAIDYRIPAAWKIG